MNPLLKALDEIERLIVAGELASAQRLLREIRSTRVPRREKSRFASLARRAQLPLLALRSLRPILYPSPGVAPQGSPLERAEYGLALAKLGVHDESIAVLETVDGKQHPHAILGMCAIHFSRWDYQPAVSLFENYLAAPSVGPYDKLVARVNLAAALVATKQTGPARELLTIGHELAKHQGLGNLKGTLHLLSAQLEIGVGDFREAHRQLERAQAILSSMANRHLLIVDKWAAILALAENGFNEQTKGQVIAVERRAIEHGEWETYRHLAANLAIAAKDQRAIDIVYHGTPYPAFRAWVQSQVAGDLDTANHYVLTLGPARQGRLAAIEPAGEKGNVIEEHIAHAVKNIPGRLHAATLRALCADAFRPLRMSELHSHLYPETPFDPDNGIERVKYALKSLRKGLASARSLLRVEARGQGYCLSATQPLRLWVPVILGQAADAELETLRANFGQSDFTAGEAAARIQSSERTARRLLARAVEQGAVTREGASRSTRYRFVSAKALRTTG